MDSEKSIDDIRVRAELLAAIRELAHLKSVTADDYTASRQGGLINLVYKIEFQGRKSSESSLINGRQQHNPCNTLPDQQARRLLSWAAS